MLADLKSLPESLGSVENLIVDCGFCSEKNIVACEAAGIEPFMAVAREDHHPGWRARFTESAPLASDATPLQTMGTR